MKEKELSMYGNVEVEEKLRAFILKHVPDFDTRPAEDKRVIHEKMVRGCRNCSLCYDTEYRPIPPILNEGCFALFIGRSPCKTEAVRNELYPKGTALGSLFDQYLSILGLGKSEVSVVNMVNCYTQGNRPPQQQCINKCVAYKKNELDIIGDKFKIVFMMGNDACHWVFGLNAPGVLSTMGEIYKVQLNGRPVVFVPIIHPSHLMIQPEYKKDVHKVLMAVREVIKQLRSE